MNDNHDNNNHDKQSSTTPFTICLHNTYVPFFICQLMEQVHPRTTTVTTVTNNKTWHQQQEFIWKLNQRAQSPQLLQHGNDENNASDSDHNNTGGILLNRCAIMGYITSVDRYLDRKTTLTIDDGTCHAIKCIQWYNSSSNNNNNNNNDESSDDASSPVHPPYKIGQLIEIKGRLHIYQQFKQVVIERIKMFGDDKNSNSNNNSNGDGDDDGDDNGHMYECHFWIQCMKSQQSIKTEYASQYARFLKEEKNRVAKMKGSSATMPLNHKMMNSDCTNTTASNKKHNDSNSQRAEPWFNHQFYQRLMNFTVENRLCSSMMHDDSRDTDSGSAADSTSTVIIYSVKDILQHNCGDDDGKTVTSNLTTMGNENQQQQMNGDIPNCSHAKSSVDPSSLPWLCKLFEEYEQRWMKTSVRELQQQQQQQEHHHCKLSRHEKQVLLLRVLNRLLDSNYIVHLESRRSDSGQPYGFTPCMIIDSNSYFQCVTLKYDLLPVIESFVRQRQLRQQAQRQQLRQQCTGSEGEEDGVPLSFIYAGIRSMRQYARMSDQMIRECVEYMINESVMYETSRPQCYKVVVV